MENKKGKIMLEVKNITVVAENESVILKDLSVKIKKEKALVMFGPNGSGKSTLIKAIMGISGYKIKKGNIYFDGKEIKSLSISERAKLGIGVMFQQPPEISGVKLYQIAKFLEKDDNIIFEYAQKLNLTEFLDRDVNVDFSGGERKRSELFQLLLQKPKLLLLDEPESGVDIENVSIMGNVLNEFLKNNECSALIITHTGYILEYISADRGCVLMNGRICCTDKPDKIFHDIKKSGYEKCGVCKCKIGN